MSRSLLAFGLALVVAAGLALSPSAAWAQKGLVYCPASIDASGCGPIVTALAADATSFPDGVETGFDGSSGTVDLATADLSGYAVLVVPALADGAGAEPYGLLRNQQIVGRLSSAFNGRNAVWSGTPDHGSTNRSAKDALLRNLAGWAKGDAGVGRGAGIVVLQDNSDDEASRYGWLRGISGLSVMADTTFEVYSNVQVLTTTGQTILTNGGLQIGYTNMASYGLIASGSGVSNDATGGRSARVVLVTTAGEGGGAENGIATIATDREDYSPGDTVIITGTGWEPGETVAMKLHEDPLVHSDRTLSTVADGDGKIFNNSFSPEEHDFGVRFVLTAVGETSGRTAQTTFTDGNKTTFSNTATGAEVNDFGTVNVNQCVPAFVQARQGSSLDATSGTVTLSSTPTGATFFSGGACGAPAITSVAFGSSDNNKAISFRFATTGSFTLNGDGSWSNSSSDASAAVMVKQPQTITFTSTAPSTAAVGGATYAAVATASSGLAVTFSSLTTAVCTSSGTNGATITPIAVGTCIVAADQAGNATFNAAPQVTQSYSVGKGSQTITFTSTAPSAAVVGGTTYTVSAGGGGSGNAVTFSSLTTGVCTSSGPSGATISFIAVGNCTVAADQAGNANYNPAPQATQTFAVAKGNQTITFTSTAPTAAVIGGSYTAAATASSGLTPVVFSSLTTSVCTSSGTNGATITFIAAGSCTVAADQAGNANYNPATQATQIFTVGKNNQTITFSLATLPAKTFGDADFSVASFASASSGLAVTFSSGSPARCSVSPAGLVHIITATGNCMVMASQGGNATYNAAADVTQTINVAKASQTITFTSTAPGSGAVPGAIVGGPTYTAAATATSGLAVTFSSSPSGVCTASGAIITFVGGGTCTVAANQTGNGDYNAAPQVTQIFSVSAKAPQTITFTSTAPVGAVFGGTYAVSATASSNLTVIFSSLTLPVCTVSGSTVSFVGTGTCTVAANQPGNASFLPAPQVTQSFAVGQASQTISFAALDGKSLGDADFTVSATASSGLTVSFAASGKCTVTGATVHLTAAGSCTITASQAGNTNYKAAPDVPQTFTIGKGGQTIAFAALGNKTYGNADFGVSATASSGLTVSFTASGNCTVAVSTVHLTGAGSCTITATQGGNDDYNAAEDVPRSFTIGKAPLAFSFTAEDKVYDGTTAAVIASSTLGSGVIGPDVVTLVNGTASFADKNAGDDKTVTGTGFTLAGANAGNYELNPATSTTKASITRRPLTVTATGIDKVYDGTPNATVTLGDNRVSGDMLAFTYKAAFGDKKAATDKPVSVSDIAISGGDDKDNYSLSNTTATTKANITHKPLAFSFTAENKVYDGTAAAVIASSTLGSGVIGSDVVTLVNGTASFADKNAGDGKTVTGSGFTLAGADGGNYVLDPAETTTKADITPRPLTVTATGINKVYDATKDATVTLGDNRVSGDVLTFTYNAAFGDKKAGTDKPVSVSDIAISGGADKDNYSLSNKTASTKADITHKPLAFSFTADNKEYDGTAAAAIASSTLGDGVIEGDAVTLVDGTASFADKNAGNGKTVTGTGFTLTGADASNYELNPTTATIKANISRRPIAVAADPQSKFYGENDPAFSYQVTSDKKLVAGDAFIGALTRDGGELVAGSPYAIKQGTLSAGPNYDLTFTGSALTIKKAPLTVAANNTSKIYGDNVPTLTGNIVGVKFSDNITATYAAYVLGGGAALVNATTPVGPYPIIPALSDPDGKLANYEWTTTNGTLTVQKAPPAFGNINIPNVIFGQGSSTVSGNLKYATNVPGAVFPTGSVSITVNGQTQAGTIQANGNFTATFNTSSFPVGGTSGLAVALAYSGSDPNFTTATGSGAMMVQYNRTAGTRFLQPVNLYPDPRSAFKITSTIPVKFQLFLADGVTPYGGANATIQLVKISTDASLAVNEEVITTPADNGVTFRYDTSGRQYIYNMGTKTLGAGMYTINANLNDGGPPVTATVELRTK